LEALFNTDYGIFNLESHLPAPVAANLSTNLPPISAAFANKPYPMNFLFLNFLDKLDDLDSIPSISIALNFLSNKD